MFKFILMSVVRTQTEEIGYLSKYQRNSIISSCLEIPHSIKEKSGSSQQQPKLWYQLLYQFLFYYSDKTTIMTKKNYRRQYLFWLTVREE